ncbi:FT-interacting protein 3 [Dionaea muscipula]
MYTKQKLVVEVIGAHNLLPKDGEGSSSPFVEVEFENQKLRTSVKFKDLNPVWNEKLVFHVADIADLPYRTLEVNVYNERCSTNSRNFLGKVRVSGSSVTMEDLQRSPQLYTLEKRSLFSHVRGEISLKMYLSTSEEANRAVVNNGSSFPRKNKKVQQPTNAVTVHHHHQQHQRVDDNRGGGGGGGDGGGGKQGNSNSSNVNHQLGEQPSPGEMKPPVVITTLQPPSVVPAAVNGVVPGGGGGGGGRVLHGGGSGGGAYSNEFSLKETSPHLGGGPLNKDKTSSTYDLVEQMQYLYVRVVKARDLPVFGIGGTAEVLAEVKLGNYKGITKRVSSSNAEWDQIFAFSKDCIGSSMAEIFIRDRGGGGDDFMGRVWFDLNEVPRRVPPDSQLAPQWYRMEDKKGDKSKGGEVMVAVWFGTQADEAFAEAWHSKAANVNFDGLCSIKSKIYLSPKLWYLRITIIEAQDVSLGEKGSTLMRYPEFLAKVQVQNQMLRTRISPPSSTRNLSNPYWNEDLIFVVAEPFEDYLLVSVEDRLAPGREEVVGRVAIPVAAVERRWDDKLVSSRWFNLDAGNNTRSFGGSRVHFRASLDGGYHVLDESTMYTSDLRPTAKQLWRPHVGVLEVGILGAAGLMPMKLVKEGGKGGAATTTTTTTTDAYCVAKYGQKWVRTRTVVDSLSPKWNEQYTWEVFDPCTVITIGVFDNCRFDKNNNNIAVAGAGAASAAAGGSRDSRIGKVRIRLSTLETDRVYTHSYPLIMLHTSGVKKTGELHLAVRFSCANVANMLHVYALPLLPKMHYVNPLSVNQVESLRYQAMSVVAMRLSRAESPLGREVVEYMLDHDSHMWSMRRSKANFSRLMNVLSGFFSLGRWFEAIRSWQRPVFSALFLVVALFLVLMPELIIPTVLIYMACLGTWRYKSRPRQPPHMDTRLSHADSAYPDELDEEFDSFPTSQSAEIVRMRYDRLRSVSGRIQTVVGDLATQGERFHALLSWRDPRATFLFVILCLLAAVGFYVVPMRVVLAIWLVYALRPPRFRSKLPSQALSFFRRLPSRADSLL